MADDLNKQVVAQGGFLSSGATNPVQRQKVSYRSKRPTLKQKVRILLGLVIIAGIGYLLFDAFYDYTDIEWVPSAADNDVQASFTGAELKLQARASDRYGDKIKKS